MVYLKGVLQEQPLWQQFHEHHNEMIITKAGRCLFPLIRINLEEAPDGTLWIDPDAYYRISIMMRPMDEHKWKWRQGRWTPLLASMPVSDQYHAGANELVFYEKQRGSEIIEAGLSFDRLKLSNRPIASGSSTICLLSFRRYLPVVRLTHIVGDSSQELAFKRQESSSKEQELSFQETEFIAVTHYQNDQITLLKKSYNPHAKGFVINDEPSSVQGTHSWMLTPERTSPASSPLQKRRKLRKRIKPVSFHFTDSKASSPTIPSDEEELQGSIALQLLGSKSDNNNNN